MNTLSMIYWIMEKMPVDTWHNLTSIQIDGIKEGWSLLENDTNYSYKLNDDYNKIKKTKWQNIT